MRRKRANPETLWHACPHVIGGTAAAVTCLYDRFALCGDCCRREGNLNYGEKDTVEALSLQPITALRLAFLLDQRPAVKVWGREDIEADAERQRRSLD